MSDRNGGGTKTVKLPGTPAAAGGLDVVVVVVVVVVVASLFCLIPIVDD